MSIPQIQDPLSFSDAAIAKVEKLIAADGNPHLKLRIYIVGGGCSGFQYGFGFDEKINEDDIVIEKDPGYGTGDDAKKALKQCPRWIPATRNGVKIPYRLTQNIVYQKM